MSPENATRSWWMTAIAAFFVLNLLVNVPRDLL